MEIIVGIHRVLNKHSRQVKGTSRSVSIYRHRNYFSSSFWENVKDPKLNSVFIQVDKMIYSTICWSWTFSMFSYILDKHCLGPKKQPNSKPLTLFSWFLLAPLHRLLPLHPPWPWALETFSRGNLWTLSCIMLLLLSCFSPVWLCHPMGVARYAPLPWGSPGRNTGVGCQALLMGSFPTQGSNPGLLHCRQILYHWATREAPSISWGLRKDLYSVWFCSQVGSPAFQLLFFL